MNHIPKLSLVILALGILSTPFFIFAADTDGARPAGFLQTFSRAFDGFSLKDIDSRIYARLQGQGEEITQTAEAGEGGPRYGDEWMTQYACNDGVDNDGDGETDWSDDPGCSAVLDGSEYGPKQCDDGVDNDPPNGLIDWRPGGTLSPGDPNCDSLTDNLEGGFSYMRPIQTTIYHPSVALYLDNNSFVSSHTLIGNAYLTNDKIYWNVHESCATECSSTPSSWWNGTLDEHGDGSGYTDVPFLNSSGVTYNLTCHKLPCSSNDNSPANDSVTITPDWSPYILLTADSASVPIGSAASLIWSGTDLKDNCTAVGWSGPQGILGSDNNYQNARHLVITDPLLEQTTFSVTCEGFDENSYYSDVTVDIITSPTPYFSINSINLIIIGPGSGGRSNKAIVGVTKSASFTGNITLTAAPALGSESLTNQGAELCLNATDGTTCSSSATILCTSSLSSTCDNTAEFWVETAGDLLPTDYTITLTADPQPPSTLASEKKTIPLRVRRFIPAFQEI